MRRTLMAIGAGLTTLGCLLLLLPMTWIEARAGAEPDGGDGSLEGLLGLVPLTVGLTVLVTALMTRPRTTGRIRAGAGR